jgi:S1-C subfamily serine protease
MVSAVRPGSRAEKDGLQAGDILVEFDGRPVSDVDTVKVLMEKSKDPSQAKIIRGKQTLNITLHFE